LKWRSGGVKVENLKRGVEDAREGSE